jgi:acetamidase/formamidase
LAGYAAGGDKPAVRLVQALSWPDQVPRRWRGAKPGDVLRVEFTHMRGNARVFAVGIYRAAKGAK